MPSCCASVSSSTAGWADALWGKVANGTVSRTTNALDFIPAFLPDRFVLRSVRSAEGIGKWGGHQRRVNFRGIGSAPEPDFSTVCTSPRTSPVHETAEAYCFHGPCVL